MQPTFQIKKQQLDTVSVHVLSRETCLYVMKLALCILMNSSFWLDTITWDSPLYISTGFQV